MTKKRNKVIRLTTRASIVASVKEWLDSRTTSKILSIVNDQNGVAYIDDDREQLKIVFPDIIPDSGNKGEVFGLILDKENGWNVCRFKLNLNNPAKSILCGLIVKIGHAPVAPVATRLFKAFKTSSTADTPIQMYNLIKLLLKLTEKAVKAA